MMQDEVDVFGNPYQIQTTYWQSVEQAYTPTLLMTGPSPGGNIGVGIIGGMINGTADYGNYINSSSGK
jgi:hypothetical protein